MARDVLMGGILARLWPAYRVDWSDQNAEYPWLLCVESPAGLLVWRIAEDERALFEYLEERPRTSRERPLNRFDVLHQLAADGWDD